jgi:hypothetical protein
MRIGFAILTHSQPEQIERLVSTLNHMFNEPSIAIHHDFSQCSLDQSRFSDNVRFVRPWVNTAWASPTLIDATLLTLRTLYEMPGAPDWFVLLSGACYPIKPAAKIMQQLEAAECDVFIDHTWVRPEDAADPEVQLGLEWHWVKYIAVPFVPRHRAVDFRRKIRLPRWASKPFLPWGRTVEGREIRCYRGSQWFCANWKAAEFILKGGSLQQSILRYYKHAFLPDEGFFQSLLANESSLICANDNKRYIDWENRGDAVPNILRPDDWPRLMQSSAHFARKFSLKHFPDLYDALDRHLGLGHHGM